MAERVSFGVIVKGILKQCGAEFKFSKFDEDLSQLRKDIDVVRNVFQDG